MPSMYDMMYGGGDPNTQQGYGQSFQRAYNNPMTQYGMRMMQGQNPFMQTLPYRGGASGQMQTMPYTGGASGAQMQNLPSEQQIERGRSGKRRIRIGNKVYEEVDDTNSPSQVPSAPAQY